MTERKATAFGATLCLLLAFMVFAWGTGYKLSLYKPQPNKAPAKVCTRGSDAAKSRLDHAVDGRNALQVALATPALALDRGPENSLPVARWQVLGGDLSPLRGAPTLYLRPPPAKLRPIA